MANPVVETNWPQGDMQWNVHNSGANNQPIGEYATQPARSFQSIYAQSPYDSQPINIPQQPIYPSPYMPSQNKVPQGIEQGSNRQAAPI